MIGVADENSTADLLFLEVTLETERRISLIQHARVHRAMR